VPVSARRATVGLAVLAATAAAALPAGAAAPAFAGNVCKLVPAAKVTPLLGPKRTCKSRKTAGPGSIDYVASWAGRTPTAPTLQVTVEKFTDPGMLALAGRNLNQGLPGPPKRLLTIGAPAFEGTGANSTAIHAGIGKYVVLLTLNALHANPPKAARVKLEALAKALVPLLQG
jgi:hypothetical protein